MPVGTGKAICVSLAHIMLGAFMFVCGAVQVILQMKYPWLDSFHAGIWVGIWMIFTGIMGITASLRNNLFFYFSRRISITSTSKVIKAFVIAFLLFSVISTLLGLASIGYYAYTCAVFWKVYSSHRNYLAIVCFTCLFAIAETIIGVCAARYSSLMVSSEYNEPEPALRPLANRIAPFDETGQVGDSEQPPEEGQVGDNVQAEDTQLPMAQMEA